MFCIKCGAELSNDAKFCMSCGSPQNALQDEAPLKDSIIQEEVPSEPIIPSPQIYASGLEQPTNQEPPKPKKKGLLIKIAAVIILAAILISGVAVLGYYTFLPAKQTLLIAEYLTVQKSYNQIDKSLTRAEEKYDAYYENSMESHSELNFSIDPDLFTQLRIDPQMAQLIEPYLKNTSLTFDMSMDIDEEKQSFAMGIDYQKNPFISFNGFLDGERFGFSVPELSGKIITGEFKDLSRLEDIFPGEFTQSDLASMSGMDPWAAQQLNKELRIKHPDIKELMTTYSMSFVNSLDSSDMTIERGQETEVLGKDIKCQEVTVKLDQKAQKKIITTLIDTMKDDDTLYNVVIDNVEKVLDVLSEQNPVLSENLESLDIKANLSRSKIKQMLLFLKKQIDEDYFPEKVTVKAYIKGFDVVKHVILIPFDDSIELSLTYENMLDGESFNKKLTIDLKDPDMNLTASLNIDKDYEKASDTEDLLIEFNADYIGYESNGNISFLIDSNEDPEGRGKINREMDIDLYFDINSIYNEQVKGKLSVAVEGEETRNNEGLYTGGDYDINLEVSSPYLLSESLNMGLAFSNTTEYGGKVNLPDLSKSDVLDISKATADDFYEYFDELYNKIMTLQMMFGVL